MNIDNLLSGKLPVSKLDSISKGDNYTSFVFDFEEKEERFTISNNALLVLLRYAASKAIKVDSLQENHQ